MPIERGEGESATAARVLFEECLKLGKLDSVKSFYGIVPLNEAFTLMCKSEVCRTKDLEKVASLVSTWARQIHEAIEGHRSS